MEWSGCVPAHVKIIDEIKYGNGLPVSEEQEPGVWGRGRVRLGIGRRGASFFLREAGSGQTQGQMVNRMGSSLMVREDGRRHGWGATWVEAGCS